MIKNIIFDFDGVILDSNDVKTKSFELLFADFDKEYVVKLIEFHKKNGGISRYEKIRYFFKNILHESINKKLIEDFAKRYSLLTKEKLCDRAYIIKDTFEFIRSYHDRLNLHIASGSDEEDLIYVCKRLDLQTYFMSINGSPMSKEKIVKNILKNHSYNKAQTILIGDSINDKEAALKNDIAFYGYNNADLKDGMYIDTFKKVMI